MITPLCSARAQLVHARLAKIVVGVLLVGLGTSTGACQRTRAPMSNLERALYDSLVAANEAMYDSATANLGFDRLRCLQERAQSHLTDAVVQQLGVSAEVSVRARHSRAELEAGNRGIAADHPFGLPRYCVPVDSLWYATVARAKTGRP